MVDHAAKSTVLLILHCCCLQPVHGQGAPNAPGGMGLRQEAYQARLHSMSTQEEPIANRANQAAAASLKGWLKKGSAGGSGGAGVMQHSVSAPFPSAPRWEGREGDGGMSHKRPRSAVEQDSDEDDEPEDDVKWVTQCNAVAYVRLLCPSLSS